MNARILAALAMLCPLGERLLAQGTTFSYQGRLDQSGVPASGHFNFQFQLYTNATLGNQLGGSIQRNGISVSNGVFNVSLDFGITPFAGLPLWLQLWVAPSNQPPPALTMLSPRQPVTPVPYAIFASTASNTAPNAVGTPSLQNNAVTGPKLAPGAAVKSLNGLTDSVSLTAGPNVTITPQAGSLQISATGGGTGWGLAGNAGLTQNNFLGATDGAQVRLHATGGFLVDNTTPSLSFGDQTRQMLNLWRSDYGIGVQNGTLYQRSDQNFAWHRHGAHANDAIDAGPGGTNLMYLSSIGDLFVNNTVTVDKSDSNPGSLFPGLAFGPNTGEGISSKRTPGGNQNGIDFYTAHQKRLSIANNGTVTIFGALNTTNGLVIQVIADEDPDSPATGQIWLRRDIP